MESDVAAFRSHSFIFSMNFVYMSFGMSFRTNLPPPDLGKE